MCKLVFDLESMLEEFEEKFESLIKRKSKLDINQKFTSLLVCLSRPFMKWQVFHCSRVSILIRFNCCTKTRFFHSVNRKMSWIYRVWLPAKMKLLIGTRNEKNLLLSQVIGKLAPFINQWEVKLLFTISSFTLKLKQEIPDFLEKHFCVPININFLIINS